VNAAPPDRRLPDTSMPDRKAPERKVVEGWLRAFGLRPGKPQERDGVVSWDLRCDGRKRSAIPITVILAPGLGCVVWIPFAPPLSDEFRKSYRRLLRWNEEYPFVKFGVSEDERPVLSAELPLAQLDEERLGEALARCVALCDLLYEDSARWLRGERPSRARSVSAIALLDRFADRLTELVAPA
jgi:Putative bacterial sensory transduction regulator